MSRRGVLLGAHTTQTPYHWERGIPRYVGEHVEALIAAAPDLIHGIDLDMRCRLPAMLDRWLTGVPVGDARRARFGAQAAAYHVMSPLEDRHLDQIWPVWARDPGVRLIATLYDLIPLLYPSWYLTTEALRRQYLARLEIIRQADAVLAISETSAADAVSLLGLDPGRVRVIHGGASAFFGPAVSTEAALCDTLRQSLPDLRDGFIFCAGGIDPRKNLSGLLNGYAQLPSPLRARHQLVITCRMTAHTTALLRQQAMSLGIDRQMLLTDYVADAVLRQLYQACRLFVFPSLYEGFGLPVVEAQRCGAPVIVHDTPALGELVPDRDARFNGASPTSLRNAMLRALTDETFTARLRALGTDNADRFEWSEVAEKTAAVYRELLASGSRARRPKWALIGPMPPEASGVADHTAALLPGLAAHCDIDVFVDGDPADFDAPPDSRVRILPWRQFDVIRALEHYDRHVVCLGNSQYHHHAWEALQRVPSDVILHDGRLVNLYASRVWSGRAPADEFDADLRRLYGDRLPPALPTEPMARIAAVVADASRHGVFMLGDALSLARRVVVHTAAAREIAVIDCPEVAGRIDVVPLPVRPRATSAPPAGPQQITAFGIVHHSKNPGRLLAAFGLIADAVPQARLVFAGDIPVEFAGELNAAAAALDCADRVEFTGRLSADAYEAQLQRTTVAVQLRQHTHGEMSGAVHDCLAAGVPTIVSEIGGLAELPADTVVHVPPDVSEAQLGEALLDVLINRPLQDSLRAAARRFADQHAPQRCATTLFHTLSRPLPAESPAAGRRRHARPVARPPVPAATLRRRHPATIDAGAAYDVSSPGGMRFLMVVDPRSEDPISVATRHGVVGNALIELMLAMVPPGARVIDVGAHLGSFSLAAAAAGCEVLAVEASPKNAALLRASAGANGFTNMRVVHAAVSDHAGELGFWSIGPWGHVATRDMPAATTVPARRLDEIVAEAGWTRVDFIKMDVEGSEAAAIRGAGALLDGPHAPAVLYECNAHTLAFFELTPSDLMRELEQLGYRNYLAGDDTLQPMQAGDVQPTILVDYLATKAPIEDRIGRWALAPAPDADTLAAALARECGHPSEENRRYIAGAISRAPDAIRHHPLVAAGLARLTADPVDAVRLAALRSDR